MEASPIGTILDRMVMGLSGKSTAGRNEIGCHGQSALISILLVPVASARLHLHG